ncbi:MAG: glycerophosphodiester phosphodiesterase [Phycisphaera sp.]|nr:glycerophosphodiester phosphodiesterase [Phycisphaera sp.]
MSQIALLVAISALVALAFAASGACAADAAAKAPRVPLIVGHRGASHDAPENTLASFRLAFERGADAVEGDYYLTADGHVVCIHDKSTKRTAGGVDLDVAHSTLEELRKLDVGAWKDPKYAGQRIPTLDEVLAVIPPGKRIVIEIKVGPEIVPAMQRAIAASSVTPDRVIFIAFDPEAIAACRELMPQAAACWITSFKQDKKSGAWSPTADDVLKTLRRIDATGLDCQAADCVDATMVKKLRDAGMALHCWTVDDPAVARRFTALGFDSLTTNRPAATRAALSTTE